VPLDRVDSNIKHWSLFVCPTWQLEIPNISFLFQFTIQLQSIITDRAGHLGHIPVPSLVLFLVFAKAPHKQAHIKDSIGPMHCITIGPSLLLSPTSLLLLEVGLGSGDAL